MFFLIISMFSCGDDDFVLDLDPQLVPYFELFGEEAAKRGVIFNNDEAQIQGYIQNITGFSGDVLGYCQPSRVRYPLESIFIDVDFWRNATDLQKEFVVFHELGHCFLKREHITPVEVDSLGNCMSMMTAGDAPCNGLDSYSSERKSALLDELFSM